MYIIKIQQSIYFRFFSSFCCTRLILYVVHTLGRCNDRLLPRRLPRKLTGWKLRNYAQRKILFIFSTICRRKIEDLTLCKYPGERNYNRKIRGKSIFIMFKLLYYVLLCFITLIIYCNNWVKNNN